MPLPSLLVLCSGQAAGRVMAQQTGSTNPFQRQQQQPQQQQQRNDLLLDL